MHIGLLLVTLGIMKGAWRTGPHSPWRTWYGWKNIWEDTTVLMKFTTLSMWIAIFLLFVVETKMYYNIDIFKNVDTPVDQIYGEVQRDLHQWYRNL